MATRAPESLPRAEVERPGSVGAGGDPVPVLGLPLETHRLQAGVEPVESAGVPGGESILASTAGQSELNLASAWVTRSRHFVVFLKSGAR